MVSDKVSKREECANLIPLQATRAHMEVCTARCTLAESRADATGVAEVAREEEQLRVSQVVEDEGDA